jgi:hypothetical protein
VALHRAGLVAKRPRWVCPPRPPASRVGKPPEVEAWLAAAAAPVPPPAGDPLADATLADPDQLWPQDLPRLLGLLAEAELDRQDEVEIALPPTLTRVWSRAGRAASGWSRRRVTTPSGTAGRLARRTAGLQLGRGGPRRPAGCPAAPGGRALAVAWPHRHGDPGQPWHPHAKGSRLLRALLEALGERLGLGSTPTYAPDANRIEWRWRSLRRAVPHTHQRRSLAELLADAEQWARTVSPAEVLSQIGSPFATDQPTAGKELDHAA